MNARPILAAAALILGLGLIGFLMWDRRPVPLVPLPDAPRDAVAIDKSAPPPILRGLDRVASEFARGDEARRERNRVAHAWIRALDDLKAGRTDQGAVERLEMELWMHRVHVGEVKAQEAHRAIAELVARELERRRKLHAAGFASAHSVREAEVLLARERYAAGIPDSDYPAKRTAFIEDSRTRFLTLARTGVMSKEVATVEIEAVEEEFPEPDVVRPTQPSEH